MVGFLMFYDSLMTDNGTINMYLFARDQGNHVLLTGDVTLKQLSKKQDGILPCY